MFQSDEKRTVVPVFAFETTAASRGAGPTNTCWHRWRETQGQEKNELIRLLPPHRSHGPKVGVGVAEDEVRVDDEVGEELVDDLVDEEVDELVDEVVMLMGGAGPSTTP